MTEAAPVFTKPKPSTFRRNLLYFFLAVAVLVGVSSVLGQFLQDGVDGAEEKIALVEVAGMITDSRDIVRQLRTFREDESIRGIILRIDSPGGAVAPSQEIYDEVRRVRKSGKPIFASMGSLAASGGYYIAAPVERIFANPGTLTGSIGVIMAFSNMEGLMKKVGLKPEVVKAGKFKDTGSPGRTLTKKERRYLQHVVNDVHSQFIEAVAEGRKIDIAEAKKIADGRIFTGRQALNMKMVDELGGLEDAIAKMGGMLGIQGRPHVIQEKAEETFMDWLLRSQVTKSLQSSLFAEKFPQLQFLWLPSNF